MTIQISRILSDFLMRSKLIQTTEELDELMANTKKSLELAYRYTETTLNEKQVTERWKFLSRRMLQNMRQQRRGPKYLKLGKSRNSSVYYKICDVEAWIITQYQLEPFVQERKIPPYPN